MNCRVTFDDSLVSPEMTPILVCKIIMSSGTMMPILTYDELTLLLFPHIDTSRK